MQMTDREILLDLQTRLTRLQEDVDKIKREAVVLVTSTYQPPPIYRDPPRTTGAN